MDPYSVTSHYSMRKMISDACGGREIIAPIDNEHPILHTYYDFDEMPVTFTPLATEGMVIEEMLPPDGVWLDDRLVAIIPPSPFDPFGRTWGSDQLENRYENPHFRFAVNVIVYALIRDGSIAEQYVNDDSKAFTGPIMDPQAE